ncbi:hypothetical protein D9M68_723070 [compost metagenome]
MRQVGAHQPQPAAQRRLRELPEVGADHHADARVAAGGLRVAHEDDGLTRRRHLDRAGNHARREHVAGRLALQFSAGKPAAHAVALRRDAPALVPQQRLRVGCEQLEFGAGQHAQRERAVGLGRAPVGRAQAERTARVLVCTETRSPQREPVALAQRAAFVAAEAGLEVGAARAENGRHVDAARHREPAAQAGLRRAGRVGAGEPQRLAGAHRHAPAGP